MVEPGVGLSAPDGGHMGDRAGAMVTARGGEGDNGTDSREGPATPRMPPLHRTHRGTHDTALWGLCVVWWGLDTCLCMVGS